MADEDALFAEFMGEIKSTVVEPVPAAEKDGAAVPDDGAASTGDVDAGEGPGEAVVDTSKRKGGGEVCMYVVLYYRPSLKKEFQVSCARNVGGN